LEAKRNTSDYSEQSADLDTCKFRHHILYFEGKVHNLSDFCIINLAGVWEAGWDI